MDVFTKARHWEHIEKLASTQIPHTDASIFSLKHVMSLPLIKFREEIEDISITAQKERDIESKLISIENEWRQRDFKFALFKNRGELLLRGQETSEILTAVDDSNLILAAVASNRYNVFFKNQIQKYIADLAISAEILTKWMQVQNLWIYLGKSSVNLSGGVIMHTQRRYLSVVISLNRCLKKHVVLQMLTKHGLN